MAVPVPDSLEGVKVVVGIARTAVAPAVAEAPQTAKAPVTASGATAAVAAKKVPRVPEAAKVVKTAKGLDVEGPVEMAEAAYLVSLVEIASIDDGSTRL